MSEDFETHPVGTVERLTAEKEALVYLVAGFVWAEACTLLDSGIDPRTHEIPNVIAKVSEALAARRDDGP